ncbi:MAG: sulfite exporter TauE/SafE family protein [Bradyrhizobium sp.]
MPDLLPWAVVSVGIFAGAIVSGLVGFAFSAVAGSILLHLLSPAEAIPLMMACSTVTQVISLVALRATVKWNGNLLLISSGMVGVFPALYLLRHVDTETFRLGFGIFLALYAGFMLLQPTAARRGAEPGYVRQVAVGFGGGLIGGLTAMPGALPTMWCDLRGLPKERQRAIVQPYITTLQIFALAVMGSRGGLSRDLALQLVLYLPALAVGAWLGIAIFRKIDHLLFRRVVLALLLVSGLLFIA